MTTTGESIECHACGSAMASGSPFCGACGSPAHSPAVLTPSASVPAAAAVPAAGGVDFPAPRLSAIADGPLAGRIPARPGRRVGAFLIDGACATVVVLIANVIFYHQLSSAFLGGSSSAITSAGTAATLGPPVVWALGGLLMVMVEGSTGATIGNAALRIRTVSVITGEPAGFGRALGRRFVEQLGSLVLFGAPVIAASSAWDPTPLRQGWQDKVAGTTMLDAGPTDAASDKPGLSCVAERPPTSSPTPPLVRQQRLAVPAPPVPQPPLTPVSRPDLTGWPAAPGAAVAPNQASPQTRPAGGLIANVPGFEPELTFIAPIPTPVAASAAVQELDEDLDHTRMSAPRAPSAGSYQLVFDTGETVVVDGIGLVGRNPAARAGEQVKHLIPIIDPERSVSKTHLVFGAGPDGFWVSDRDSTNGTRTVSDTGVTTAAGRDIKLNVPMGGAVEFGQRRFTVAQL